MIRTNHSLRSCSSKRPAAGQRWLLALLASIFVVMTLVGCRAPSSASPLQRYEFKHPAMGTLFTITLYAASPTAAEEAAGQTFQRIDALEDIMSDYQADSELMRLIERPVGKPVAISSDLLDIFQIAQRFSAASDGAFDITVGPYVRLWRFARKRKVLPSSAELADAAKAVGSHNLRLDAHAGTATLLVPHMRLDLGGIAKGYAADQALRVLKGRGINRALVAASGDIAIGDPPPGEPGWKVGIAGIDEANNQVSRTIMLHNAGVSTSGDTEQFIEIDGVRYSHILDPVTGLGLTNRIQATLIARDATTTDALATAVCVLGPQRGLALADRIPHTAALILTQDSDRKQSFASHRFRQITAAR